MSADTRPVLVYDGKCGFCKLWIEYCKALTQDAIAYAPSQEVGDEFPQVAPAEFAKSVQLVYPSGEVVSGSRAVYQTLAANPSRRLPLQLYHRFPGFASLSEAGYRFIARHRSLFYWITVLLIGRNVEPLRFDVVQSIFRSIIGAIYLIAFVSFGVQAMALIGSRGVLPVSLYFHRIQAFVGGRGWQVAPSLFWLSNTDSFINAVWIIGAFCAVVAITGILWRPALFVCFLCYLSLVNGSQEFLGYQWDILLLEAGFLSLFLGYSKVVIWLFRWLLFRLMFLSGAVKLLSGDPTWHSLTALMVHFQTQPIPTPLAWYANQLPAWFLQFSCALVFVIELVLPFFIFGPKRIRLIAAAGLIGLQLLILITGNYAFFNWLSLALCLFLFDDGQLRRWLKRPWSGSWFTSIRRSFLPVRVRKATAGAFGILIVFLSTLFFIQTLRAQWLPSAARSLISVAAPFGITSTYGLFANMTTTRPEIIIEGSTDGITWQPYEFRYKPGLLDRRPPWVAPHQPRLDWQMWFAALGNYQENVWFLNLLARLLQAEPVVLAQLARSPFGNSRPTVVRAIVYEYKFTDRENRRKTGNWWTHTQLGSYVPPVTLQTLSRLPILRGEVTGSR